MCPDWVRARALSMYLLVLQGGMAIGSAAWGALATRIGVPMALFCSALALVLGLASIRRHRLSARDVPCCIGVVDAQQECAAMAVGEGAVRDRGERVSDVERPGRARSKAHLDHAANVSRVRRVPPPASRFHRPAQPRP